jgi:hypothetical protein
MKDIEAAIGENDFLALLLQVAEDFLHLGDGFDLFIAHDPARKKRPKRNQKPCLSLPVLFLIIHQLKNLIIPLGVLQPQGCIQKNIKKC